MFICLCTYVYISAHIYIYTQLDCIYAFFNCSRSYIEIAGFNRHTETLSNVI